MKNISYALIIVLVILVSNRYINNIKQRSDHMITPDQVHKKIDQKEKFILVDVRTEEEFEQGRIPGSILIPVDELGKKAHPILKDKNEEIIVYCRSGVRSKAARNILSDMGYKKVLDLGGIIDWPYGIEK